ncbi:MAG TPA: mechanosensitive ion channel protein MscS [Bacteroidetes bacterium]|nr:mechanosensitive ion channel protein MscS [Bacteroidota bacterium]
MDTFLEQEFLSNTYRSIGFALLAFLIGYVLRKYVARMFANFLYRFFKKFSEGTAHDEFVDLLVKPFQVIILFISLYLALVQLQFPDALELGEEKIQRTRDILHRLYFGIMVVCVTWLMLRVVDFMMLILYQRAQLTEDKSDDQIILFMKDMIKVTVVVFAIFFIMSAVFKLDITTLIAGLGIGGLAIALAAQDTLSNLLASFIIFMDKPFKAGDLVNFDTITGTIEKVGFRSTKVRTLDKSLLTVPNKDLTDGPLNNITESPFRRVKFMIGLTYDTPAAKISKVIEEINEVLDNHPETKDDYTVAFSDFSSSSLDIMILFFVFSNDWEKMVRVKEEINFKIMHIVERNGCEFAFPTQTIHMAKGNEPRVEL